MKKKNGDFLKVFLNKSELVHADGRVEIFEEGIASIEAINRYKKIVSTLQGGYLDELINECKNNRVPEEELILHEKHSKIIDDLVSSVTSEVGRALVGLTVLQLCVKTIEPRQSIRLHKAGRSAYNFSWKGGISMRTLDKNYITPLLRSHSLLRLNADGFMMTRSLAENYPYSPLYKANLRGARNEWLALVEEIETGNIDPNKALRHLICKLINTAEEFTLLADQTLEVLQKLFIEKPAISQEDATKLIEKHINASGYAARLMEIAMHSLFQAIKDEQGFGEFELMPLSQMRSANKKHGNIGDIELTEGGNITISWDAKYGKTYLRDELEELADKLQDHGNIKYAGFVTSEIPERMGELQDRMREMESSYNIDLKIIPFAQWVEKQFEESSNIGISNQTLSRAWLKAYTESIAQKRREIAPIDEPCDLWLKDLNALIRTNLVD